VLSRFQACGGVLNMQKIRTADKDNVDFRRARDFSKILFKVEFVSAFLVETIELLVGMAT